MCRRNVDFKVGDFVKARRDIDVTSGDFLMIPRGSFGIIKTIDGSNAIVCFTKDGIDHNTMVRVDYIKKTK